MLGDEDRLSLLLRRPHELRKLLDGPHVQVGGRLVEDQHIRVGGIGAGECDLLLLPAGKLEHASSPQRLEVQLFGDIIQSSAKLRPRDSPVFQSEHDLAVDIGIEELGPWILEYGSHRIGERGDLGFLGIHAVHAYGSRELSFKEMGNQPVHEPGDRRLPAARCTAEQDAFSTSDAKGQSAHAAPAASIVLAASAASAVLRAAQVVFPLFPGEGRPIRERDILHLDHQNTPFAFAKTMPATKAA